MQPESKLSPEFWIGRFNVELGRIHRRTPLELAAIPIIAGVAWFLVNLGITEYAAEITKYGGADPALAAYQRMWTTIEITAEIIGAGILAGAAGATSIHNIRRRGNIFNEARAKGLEVRGGFWREQIY